MNSEKSQEVKPIVIVCGAPHSMTSMVQKFLMDNGAHAHDIWENTQYQMHYNRYESKALQEFVMEKKAFKSSSLESFFENLAKDKVICMKAPMAAFFLEDIRAHVKDRTVRVVYVLRNPKDQIMSKIEKSSSPYNTFSYSFELYSATYDMCAQYSYDMLPVMSERILNKNIHTMKRLLEYCELYRGTIITDSITTKMVKTRTMSYVRYRRLNFFWKRLARILNM